MTKSILILAIAVAFLIGTITIQTNSNISAQEDSIPSWVKINAGFWANNLISDTDFLNGIEYLIGQEIIQVSYEIPQAVAQIETPQPLTFYVVEGYELENESKVICDKGDTAISGGWDIEEEWKDSVPLRAETNHPFKTSEDLSYYDGWQFSYEKTQDWSKKTLYVVCADTNL